MSWTIRYAVHAALASFLFAAVHSPTGAQSTRPGSTNGLLLPAAQPGSPHAVIHTSFAGPKRFLYTYGPDGRMETERVQRITSGTWVDSLRRTWTYTATGRLKSEYDEQYLLGAFRAMSRWSIEYNEAGDVVISLSERGSWVLEPHSRAVYTYAAPGRVASVTYQSWSGSWTNDSRSTNTWSAGGVLTGYVYEQWTGGRWDTTSMTTVSYISDSLKHETYRTRNKGDGSWRDSSMSCRAFDDAGNTHVIEEKAWTNGVLTWAMRTTGTFDVRGWLMRCQTEELVGNVMTPTQRFTSTYDFEGNELVRVGDAYDAGEWHPEWKLTSTFDGSGNILASRAYVWGSAVWVPSTGATDVTGSMSIRVADACGNSVQYSQFASLAFSYSEGPTDVPTASDGGPRTFELSQNFPNPFNPSTTIRYGLPARSHVTIRVFNTLGEAVATLVHGEQDAGYHEVRFDGANLPSGVYMCRMQSGDHAATKKLLLVR